MCSRCSTPGTWLLDHITARNLVPVRRLISPSGWKTHNALHHRFLPPRGHTNPPTIALADAYSHPRPQSHLKFYNSRINDLF